MTNQYDLIIALVVTGGGIIGGLIHIRRRDRQEHAENGAKLDGISFMLGKVDQKIDDHLTDHKERRR